MGDAAEGLAGGQGYPYIARESKGPTEAPKWRCMLSSRPKLFRLLCYPCPCLSAALMMNEASAAADAIINVGRPTDDALSLWSTIILPHCCWNARLIVVDPRRIDSGACGALATTAASGQAHGLRSITLAS